jgi:hypothetical protein
LGDVGWTHGLWPESASSKQLSSPDTSVRTHYVCVGLSVLQGPCLSLPVHTVLCCLFVVCPSTPSRPHWCSSQCDSPVCVCLSTSPPPLPSPLPLTSCVQPRTLMKGHAQWASCYKAACASACPLTHTRPLSFPVFFAQLPPHTNKQIITAKDLDESSYASWASRYKAACASAWRHSHTLTLCLFLSILLCPLLCWLQPRTLTRGHMLSGRPTTRPPAPRAPTGPPRLLPCVRSLKQG